MITRYIKGDITETELEYIAHGVNTQNVMGSGVAKVLFTKWPQVKSDYHGYCNGHEAIGYSIDLGEVNIVCTEDDLTVFNCFTQEFYGYDGDRYVNYAAIVKCFNTILDYMPHRSKLAIPKIGCGLAGGDWNIVEQLINDTVGDDLEIWVYEI
jgi:O-acetyl-ADP-ribose deacetylase (regulator of RNase III)